MNKISKSAQEQIFKEWISEFKPLLFKIVRVYAYSLEDENDLFQEIVIQIWKSVLNFNGQSSVHTWIYRVALNTSIKWSTRNRIKGHVELTEALLISPTEKEDSKLDWLYNEIAKLDTVDKSLTLLMLDGFSYKEMANILGITTSNVGVKINRIKTHLQEQSKSILS